MQLEVEQRIGNPYSQLAKQALTGLSMLFGLAAVLSYVYLVYVVLTSDSAHAIDLIIHPIIILVPYVVGLLIVRKHPGHTIGLLFLFMAYASAVRLMATAIIVLNATQSGAYSTWIEAITLNVEHIAWLPGVFVPLLVMPFYFPTGKLLSPIWRVPVVIVLVNLVWMAVAITLHPWPWPLMGVPDTRIPNGIPGSEPLLGAITTVLNLFMVPLLVLIPAALFFRYRRSGEVERIQLKWPLAATIVFFFAGLLITAFPELSALDTKSRYAFTWTMAMMFPISVGIAILRHRLFDIDILINRALVYGILTTIIIALYVAIIGGLGHVIQTQTSVLNGLVATAIVAVIFQPLREWLQRGVNRILYGERDNPTLVLSQLARQLETADTSAPILPTLVQTIAHTLKIPYVAICSPAEDDGMAIVLEWGEPAGERETIPLIYQNQTIGSLVVTPRSATERFTQNERLLLTTIAALTATTFRAVQLSDELRQSRQRIVTAREEERRRIRRDLHDGLGPQLASQTLSLEAIAQLMATNPSKARSLLESLQVQAYEAMADVRRLIYDLRPPALDDLGLVGALQQSASRYETSQLHFRVESGDLPDDLPAAIETAAFRITQEAMTNVVRHAGASHCTVRLYCTGDNMIVEIRDDGCGLPAYCQSGIGLRTMRERAAELNGETVVDGIPEGGTSVRAKLPLEVYRE